MSVWVLTEVNVNVSLHQLFPSDYSLPLSKNTLLLTTHLPIILKKCQHLLWNYSNIHG
uniref:Uncharacterized protein n=1 Tax=Arundo donax TaxID=35708 RepID=A0A0A8ZSJ3_ARUDO